MYNLKKNDWMIVPEPLYDSKFVANDRDAQMSNGRNIPMYNNKDYHPENNGLKAKWFWLPQSMDDTTWRLQSLKRLAGRRACGEL